ncbi:MAG: Release factor glutamine methyltransferase [Polaribacter sp. SA4-10]|nr:MAG: Release factor glutamine methyltransferase [Polaribacter sp. SA4-10]
MILKKYKSYFTKELASIYPQTEIDTFFFLLAEEYLNFMRIDVVLKSDFNIPTALLLLFNNALEKLKKEKPIQYILGKTEFYGFTFLVDSYTLIPRPETEELVDWVLEEVNVKQSIKIIDIGTGSGCIPISLAKHLPEAKIEAIDVSFNALSVAKQNAVLNKVDVFFIEKDILKTEKLDKKFDIIISNPPYVRELEKKEIKNNVLENEPHIALFVKDNNPLIFYNKIADLAKKNLSKNGILFFEINQYLGKETVGILRDKGFRNIQLKKDLFGNNRMIKCELI